MYKRSIIIFLKFKNIQIINDLRKQYDPLFDKIAPHISLVFPFVSDISREELETHVKYALKGLYKFDLRLNTITGTEDSYLFLNVKIGNDEIIELHDKLYAGILKQFLYRGLTFVPHLTIGKLHEKSSFIKALKDLEEFDYGFYTVIDEISVELIDENENSQIEFSVKLE